MPIRDIFRELLAIITLALVAAFVINGLSPVGIALFGDWDTVGGVITAKARKDVVDHGIEIRDISIAKEIYDIDAAVFPSARRDTQLRQGNFFSGILH